MDRRLFQRMHFPSRPICFGDKRSQTLAALVSRDCVRPSELWIAPLSAATRLSAVALKAREQVLVWLLTVLAVQPGFRKVMAPFDGRQRLTDILHSAYQAAASRSQALAIGYVVTTPSLTVQDSMDFVCLMDTLPQTHLHLVLAGGSLDCWPSEGVRTLVLELDLTDSQRLRSLAFPSLEELDLILDCCEWISERQPWGTDLAATVFVRRLLQLVRTFPQLIRLRVSGVMAGACFVSSPWLPASGAAEAAGNVLNRAAAVAAVPGRQTRE
jgi:hypothetical protein